MNDTRREEDTLVIRPRKARVACWTLAGAVLVVCVAVATALRGTTEGGGQFNASDQFAMIGLGALLAAGILAFTRPLVRADATGVHVRNVFGAHDVPWSVVERIAFQPGTSWATLEFADGDALSMMAIQAVDKQHSVDAVRELRARLDRARQADRPSAA